ncbi:MAG: HPr(Ser) kinase/phosphatase [Evtepia gabavorous]
MASQSAIKLTKSVERFELEVLNQGKNYDRCLIRADDINRPALQILGFFDYFAPDRIQVIGKVEWTYLNNQSPEERRKCFDAFWESPSPPPILATCSLEPFPERMEMAESTTEPSSAARTPPCSPNITAALKSYLAPRITRHGVLVEVYGEGVLLLGESGVGKSETAIELVKRGHRLIADDAVEIKRNVTDRLVGTAPELIRHYIELRGIGVIDVCRLFGMSAVKDEAEIDMVINLEQWKDGAMYDRLGLENLYTTILDVQVPSLTVPVPPGRNLAVIIEVAAMNNRHKKMGYNAAVEFTSWTPHFEQMMSAPAGRGGRL